MYLSTLAILFWAAVAAASTSGTDTFPICPDCAPCRLDCACVDQHIPICAKPPSGPVKGDPLGRSLCAENQPCTDDCICPPAIAPRPKVPPKFPDGIRACAEGQPCPNDGSCECDMLRLFTFINPANLSLSTAICKAGQCADNCICREQIIAAVNAVLLPKKGTPVNVNFQPVEGRDEL